jgi:hypothetical protein
MMIAFLFMNLLAEIQGSVRESFFKKISTKHQKAKSSNLKI